MKKYFFEHQQKIAMIAGYTVVFCLAFALGRTTALIPHPPQIVVEEPTEASQDNNTPDKPGAQSDPAKNQAAQLVPVDGECGGKIKGNISSSGKVYHLPGGSFYKRTSAEACFNTEAEAQAAGFRKSKQ